MMIRYDASRAADFLLAMERARSIGEDIRSARRMTRPNEFGNPPNVIVGLGAANHERYWGGFKAGVATSASTTERSPNRGTFGPTRTLGRGR
jgi:hypothetical protein